MNEFQKETETGGVADPVLRADVAPGDPNWRYKGPDVTSLPKKVAEAQHRITEQNAARQAGKVKTPAQIEAEENEHIVGVLTSHQIGLVAIFNRRLARLAFLEKKFSLLTT